MILTTDGGVGALLLHPDHHVTKVYSVELAHNRPIHEGGGDGLVSDSTQQFRHGVVLADGSKCAPAKLELQPAANCICTRIQDERNSKNVTSDDDQMKCQARTQVRVHINEGKFHQVKRMLSAVGGHGVRNLHRESFGPLCLANMKLAEGAVRPLSVGECEQLRAMLPAFRACVPKRKRTYDQPKRHLPASNNDAAVKPTKRREV
mmetsp:Transcript_16429/g.24102  ORF Transcript_16429/g.24102 Transcript_16429/m.24102 type:complete len:205 (-) Transcript_16429:130-744(-)